MGKVKMQEEETLHPHEILRQNLKRTNKLVTKDGQIKKKVPKQFTEYKCKVCHKTFNDKTHLSVHEKIHGPATYQCPECPFKAKTRKYLTCHRKKVHVVPTAHKCNVCGKMFHFECKLREHAMVHTGEKPHKCEVCGKAFRVTYSLNVHMLGHTNETPFKCSFCDYACRDSSTLRKHENRHMGIVKVFPCKLCPKKFPEKAKLKYHISDYHLDYLDLDHKKHTCEHCGKKIKNKYNLRKHIEAVHEKSLGCECPVCGKKVSNKYNLTAHLRSHFSERPYACTFDNCGKRFKDKGTLKKHVIIHQPHLHHVCRVCGAGFTRPHRLVSHMRVHEPRDKCVQCDYCGVKFYTKNYLIKHITQKHTKNKKKYICDNCGLKTYNKPSIVMHLKYGHCNNEDLSCKICKTKYKLFEYLKAHYLKTHNIRYKPMKMGTRKKKERKPAVEIKVEPLDPEELFEEEIHIIDVPKEEILEEDPNLDDDSLTYSKQVLSEDLADCLINEDNVENVERNFDAFLYKHVFHKQIKQEGLEQTQEVNEEQRSYVNEKVKEIMKISQEPAKKKPKEENLLKRKREKQTLSTKKLRHQDKVRRRKRRQYIRQLKKVRYGEEHTEDSNMDQHADNTNPHDAENPERLNEDSSNEVFNQEDSSKDTAEGKVACGDDISNAIRITEINATNSINKANEHRKISTFDVSPASNDTTEHHNNKTPNPKAGESTNNVNNRDNVVNKNESNDNDSDANDDDLETMKRKRCLEVQELEKVRQMYNQRMKIAAEKSRKKEPVKSIKYFHQKTSDESPNNKPTNQTNDKDINHALENEASNSVNDSPNQTNTDKAAISENSENEIISKTNEVVNSSIDTNSTSDEAMIKDGDNVTKTNDSMNDTSNNDDFNKDKINNADANDDTSDEKSDNDSDYEPNSEEESTRNKKIKFKTHQCYVCFKLFPTKESLISHCEGHFTICNSTTLAKCPCCGYVTNHHMRKHMLDKHQIRIQIPYTKITQREDCAPGSKYCFRMDKEGNLMEIIPSVQMLNHDAAIQLDRKNRERKDKTVARSKLVRKGGEWVVENVPVDVCYKQLPEFTEQELSKLKVSKNYVDRLGQLGKLAKKKGIKMVFPCDGCDKICQNFSGLKLHSRRHDPNKKPFAPKHYSYNQWKQKRAKPATKKPEAKKIPEKHLDNRFAKPNPIKNKHKCDERLKKFYETHIRGADIEFWQFLKIFNKMGRENIEDFKDFEGRTDFGHHGYLDENFKDPLNSGETSESAKEAEESNQRRENVTERGQQSGKVAERTQQRGKVADRIQQSGATTERTQKSGKVTKRAQQSGKEMERTQQSGYVVEMNQQSGKVMERTQQSGKVTERTQQSGKITEWTQQSGKVNCTQQNVNVMKGNENGLNSNNIITRKPYIRVIRISRKEHMEREKAKTMLREKFAKKYD